MNGVNISEKVILGIGGVVTALIGGWDLTLQILMILMAVDVVTGVLKAFKTGAYVSKTMREGIVTKAGYILVIILCYQLDVLMVNNEPVVRTICVIFYITVEGSSVIENLGQMGVPIPKFVSKGLARLRELSDEGVSPKDKLKDNFQ